MAIILQFPYLGAERVFLLHFLRLAEISAGSIVPPVWEDGVTEDIVASPMVFNRESQLDW
ncbi:MAG: hypothetical protein LQ343_000730 [Gyalolechia ehrenbergii]|nr:MAG: hypothetical protein LQ343_000730 [Gyalolechia ehrenbergii]